MTKHDSLQPLSALVKSSRLRAGQSRVDAAEFLGVSVEKIEAWEEGADPIPLEKLHAMARHFQVDPYILMRTIAEAQALFSKQKGPEGPGSR